MAAASTSPKQYHNTIGEHNLSQECRDLLHYLPKHKGWLPSSNFYLYKGFWCMPVEIQSILNFQKHFQDKDNDIIVATQPKSGTTWLKALTFCLVNRHRFAAHSKDHPLLGSNPHELVPSFEYNLYSNNQNPNLSSMYDDDEPRLFSTHVPFHALPNSIKDSNCKVVYICRNPYDTFVSLWHFVNKLIPSSLPSIKLEDAFENYCNGVCAYGPFWSHMLSYWETSKERPDKVLFIKYEDLKCDTKSHVMRVAEFLGCRFTHEEEREGVVEKIIEMCKFENMRELEVNKSGTMLNRYENKNFFRKGEVGDYVNHFSQTMVERLSKVMHQKLESYGLSFQVPSSSFQ